MGMHLKGIAVGLLLMENVLNNDEGRHIYTISIYIEKESRGLCRC